MNERINNFGNFAKEAALEPIKLLRYSFVGGSATVVSLITLGKFKHINSIASSDTHAAKKTLSNVFESGVKVLNPEYDYLESKEKNEPNEPESAIATPACQAKYKINSGIFTKGLTVNIFFNTAKSVSCDKSFIVGVVYTRGLYLTGALSAIVTRVADLSLGIFAVAGAILTLGRFNRVNDFAMEQLTFFGVINDVSRGLRGFVNPQQSKLKPWLPEFPDFDKASSSFTSQF